MRWEFGGSGTPVGHCLVGQGPSAAPWLSRGSSLLTQEVFCLLGKIGNPGGLLAEGAPKQAPGEDQAGGERVQHEHSCPPECKLEDENQKGAPGSDTGAIANPRRPGDPGTWQLPSACFLFCEMGTGPSHPSELLRRLTKGKSRCQLKIFGSRVKVKVIGWSMLHRDVSENTSDEC